MWEYCISIDQNNIQVTNYITEKLAEFSKQYDYIVTKLEQLNKTQILVACNNLEKNRLVLCLQEIIDECICYYFKKDFLLNNLTLKLSNSITKQAFISALLFFDKDTDRYIVNKYLEIDKKIDLYGFFNFKLSSLRQKWQELTSIANENQVYLYSDETFVELIKFLVDNIEIKSEVINIMSTKESYSLFDYKFDNLEQTNEMSDEKLVDTLIALCPKNINIYCSDKLSSGLKNLICKLFEKRVRFVSSNC